MRCDLNLFLIYSRFVRFNPHTYMRCDVYYAYNWVYPDVSIHTPTWGVTQELLRQCRFIIVSIHTPTWGVTHSRYSVMSLHGVSIHTPTWGVTYSGCWYVWCFCVSIHTPTWGVTYQDSYSLHLLLVSIHTPTWGVTSTLFRLRGIIPSFNPHTYMRCDIRKGIPRQSTRSFNPHTYMRCDPACVHRRKIQIWFQSTHLHEVWRFHGIKQTLRSRFQSTHLHEVWQCEKGDRAMETSFNPHTYMRCDTDNKRQMLNTKVSIHTPTWGVTCNG